MAVDYRGQPITNQTAFTTTGIMNRKPAAVKPPNLGNIKQPQPKICLLYTSPSPRDGLLSRMPSSA